MHRRCWPAGPAVQCARPGAAGCARWRWPCSGSRPPRRRTSRAQTDPDEDYVGPLLNQALETERTGVAVPWSNPATGSSGMIMIERTFYRDPDTPCRDYRRTLEQPGRPTVEIQGTGCRIASGHWSLDEEEPEPPVAA